MSRTPDTEQAATARVLSLGAMVCRSRGRLSLIVASVLLGSLTGVIAVAAWARAAVARPAEVHELATMVLGGRGLPEGGSRLELRAVAGWGQLCLSWAALRRLMQPHGGAPA